MITQEDQSGVALSAMHQLVNDFELTKQKLADEKEERRVEKNQFNRRIAELEQQNAEQRQLRKRVERQRDLQAQRATDAETREAQLRIRLQARDPIDDIEPQQPPDNYLMHSSGYNTFDSRGAQRDHRRGK